MKYERYVIEPVIKSAEELPYHKKGAPGVRRVFLEKSLLEETDVYLMVRTVKDVTPEQPEYIETHAHNVNSAYIFVGEKDNLEGLLLKPNSHPVYCFYMPHSIAQRHLCLLFREVFLRIIFFRILNSFSIDVNGINMSNIIFR